MLNPNDFNSIIILTGAGISAESGLKTFRDNGGLWEGHRVEDVATPEAFNRDPELVHTFYNMRREQLLKSASPNSAHTSLAKFEKQFDGEFMLITQNVDDLHEQSGSQNVRHMHGELLKAQCIRSQKIFDISDPIDTSSVCSCCHKTDTLRPHIVWFGEMPLHMEEIEQKLAACDLFISIGTSGQVYPAAGFVQLARSTGATTIELNLEPSDGCSHFNHAYYGPATKVVNQFFEV